uniref:Uncharacterized protein n=1 Tax=Rhizophora mucronata TaxID=61149 RepID=A0A2P2PD82_RHIMU
MDQEYIRNLKNSTGNQEEILSTSKHLFISDMMVNNKLHAFGKFIPFLKQSIRTY